VTDRLSAFGVATTASSEVTTVRAKGPQVVGRGEKQTTAWPQHSSQFMDCLLRMRYVFDRFTRDDRVEGGIVNWDLLHAGDEPRHARHRSPPRPRPSELHCRTSKVGRDQQSRCACLGDKTTRQLTPSTSDFEDSATNNVVAAEVSEQQVMPGPISAFIIRRDTLVPRFVNSTRCRLRR